MIEVPPPFVASTVAREGDAGRAWIESLPRIVEELCEAWSLAPVGEPWHGYVALVVPVERGGERFVLKVSWIDQSSEQEPLVLRAWGGDGAVRLLDARGESGAMLLERLDETQTLERVPSDEATAIAGGLLRRLAIPAPAELRTVRAEVEGFAPTMAERWERLGRPFPRRLLEVALDVSRLASQTTERVIVNQDLHYANVLGAVREPWLVIDPKALAGPVEFGVAQLLWNRFDELDGQAGLERRLAIVAEAADIDASLAREWTTLRLVDDWLWSLGQDMREDATRYRALSGWLDPRLTG